jgi:gliding motility-associated-like protein
VATLPIITIIANDSIFCSGEPIYLQANSNHSLSSIIWSNGNIGINMQAIANHSKYYFLEAFDSNYCIGHDSIYLEVKATPSCAIQGAEHVCENESAAYSYIGNGGNNLNYNWHFDGLPNLSGNQNGLVYAQWTQAGNYQIILQVEEFQCFSIPDTLIVQVNPVPILNFTTQSNHHCDSSSVKFISDNPAMASYAWNFGDPLSNADTSSLESPSYIYSVPGNYSVSLLATNQFGCSSSLTIDSLVTVFPKPNASFRVSTKKPDLNNSRVNFFNYSTDYDQLSWDFGEPASGIYNTTDETHPYHIYISEGQFIAKLMLENNYQCFDTAYTIIRIEDGSRLYVPSAFSPDGNGLNDYFLPIFANEEIKEFEMYIFNRWGINTFSTHQYEGWNGNDQNSNESCEPNFYSYVIYIIDSKNVRRKYTGSLTLVR